MKKHIYIIAGCNGAGKTTASYTILPDILNCKEFVNADEIAKGLSPFQPERVSIEAGRLMLKRIDNLIDNNISLAFETTLANKTYKHKVKSAQKKGYKVILLFFWLRKMELAIERVKIRVSEGGHNIEKETIIRRYYSGLNNLFNIYLPLVDEAMIFDNSESKYELIAEKIKKDETIRVIDKIKFSQIKNLKNA